MHGWPQDPPGLGGLLAEVTRVAPVGVGVVDAESRLMFVNDALAAMAGRPVADMTGRRTADALPRMPAVVSRCVQDTWLDGRPRRGVLVEAPSPEGQTRWFLGDFVRLEDSAGVAVAVACFATEVTAQHRAERELALTGLASGILASSLEPDVAVAHLMDLLVPGLADHAYVDLRVEGPRLRRLAIRHADGLHVPPGLERPVGELSQYAPDHPIRQALDTQEVVWIGDLSAADREVRVPETADTDVLRVMGARSVMVVPMVVAGRVLGTVGLFTSASGRHYVPDDVRLVTEVVSRAAAGLSHALDFAQQRSAAVQLQRSLLPAQLPVPVGLEVAWRYEPGTAGTEVGGDWADVLELPSGRVAVVVGDVMGRGVQAAAVMGQVRTAVRTLARAEPQPSDLLTSLDQVVEGLPGEQIVTCVLGVYDPGTGRMCIANAGHLPPQLRRGDGVVTTLEEPLDPPLGTGWGQRAQRDVVLEASAVLAMFTDGLVERPGGDLDEALAGVASTLAMHGGASGSAGLEALADAMLAAAPAQRDPGGTSGFGDDVALLLVRALTDTAHEAVTTTLPALPSSVSAARRFVLATLAGWRGSRDALERAELMVSEVVTNAVRYATGGDVDLLVRHDDRHVWVEVADGDTRQPRLRQAAPDDEGGRGLALVQALASSWGSRPTADGKSVWFRLDLR